MRRAVLLPALAAVLLLSAASSAAAAPHVIVWSGGLSPGSGASGVELRADGSGRRLQGSASAVRTAGSWSPKGRQREAIRDAAKRLLSSGPAVTHADRVDGGYVSVLVEDGGRRRAIVDSGKDSPAVERLLKAVNATLPAKAPLAGAGGSGESNLPAQAPCPPGQHATDVVKDVSMKDAAFAGLVNLKPKGGYAGDSIAVHGKWKPVTAPTKITCAWSSRTRTTTSTTGPPRSATTCAAGTPATA